MLGLQLLLLNQSDELLPLSICIKIKYMELGVSVDDYERIRLICIICGSLMDLKMKMLLVNFEVYQAPD